MDDIRGINRRVPYLRFSEFNGIWKTSTLGQETSYTKGFAFKSHDYRKEGVRIIRVSDLAARHIKKNNDNIYIENNRSDEFSKWKIHKNEIVITTVGSRPDLIESAVGRGIFINQDGEGLLNQNMLKLKCKHGNAAQFVFSQINTTRYIDYISQIKRGNANQANITVKDLLDCEISITEQLEQLKIADFLTAVDARIGQLMQKKALLMDYKKGVMQQLFSQTIRFKDKVNGEAREGALGCDEGDDFPDWEEKRLGDVAELSSSKRVYLSDYVENGVPFYRGKEISELRKGIAPKDILYIAEEAYDNYKLKYGVPQIGDILITAVGTLGNILRINNSDPFYFKDGNLIWLKSISENSSYIEIFLEYSKKEIEKTSIGSSQKALTMVELKKLRVVLPINAEQTKIANFISVIDQKIETVSSQITETQTFKRGLLQQMFV